MKLKNKISGEIKEFTLFDGNELQGGATLESLTKEWEDAPEEPKKYWFIDAYGNIVQNEITKHYGDEYTDMTDAYENQKQIGNYFDTPEEAEKAVEKLRAYKRLKDKGFRFNGWVRVSKDLKATLEITAKVNDFEIYDDLDLLFCTEDN